MRYWELVYIVMWLSLFTFQETEIQQTQISKFKKKKHIKDH